MTTENKKVKKSNDDENVVLNADIQKNEKAIEAVELTLSLVKTSSVTFELFDKIATTIGVLDSINNYLKNVKEELANKVK